MNEEFLKTLYFCLFVEENNLSKLFVEHKEVRPADEVDLIDAKLNTAIEYQKKIIANYERVIELYFTQHK